MCQGIDMLVRIIKYASNTWFTVESNAELLNTVKTTYD